MVNPYRFYTYAYLREDRTPYYIGKGGGNRAYYKCRGEIKPPKDKSRIIFLKQSIIEEEAFKHEIYMIAVFGRKDLGTGILHNRTDGGEGVSGALRSEEYKRKLSDFGKIGGTKTYEMKVGIHGLKPEQMSENGKKGYESGLGKLDEKEKSNAGKRGGKRTAELKVGVHEISPEKKSELGKMGSQRAKELGVGIFSLSSEQLSENGKKGGKLAGQKNKENKTGICGFSKEQRIETGKKVAFQKWICLETGFITNAGNLTRYQKARGIDTTNRRRIS